MRLFKKMSERRRRREIIHNYIAKINQIDKTLLSENENINE
jgi:hypothetical protein